MVAGVPDENQTRCAAFRPTEDLFVGSKAPWYEVTDDLPQNEEY